MKPKVNVITITYNQEKYISQALDSFLSQKTDFPFVVIVADDCSTDGTQDIIREYARKYPTVIKQILREKNIGSQENFVDAIKHCNSDYIAICDGDDYWCDEYKLQKQVDFMEKHPDYALCYHPAKMIYTEEKHAPVIIGKAKHKNPQPYYELIKANNIPACSVMYRAEYLKQELLNYPESIYPGDWFNHISVARHGKIGYLPDVMYVYRWHSQGVSYTISDDPVKEIHLKYGVKEVNFSYAVWNKIKEQFPQYYKDVFIPVLRDVYFVYLKNGKFKELELLQKNYAGCFKDIDLNTGINEINNYRKKYKKYKKLLNLLLLFVFVILFCVFLILLLFLQ